MATVTGIDLDSRSVALSVVDPSSYAATRMTRIVAPDSITERAAILRFLKVELEHHYDWFKDSPTFVEAPVLAGARNIQSTIKIAGVYGVTLASVGSWTPVIEVPVPTWKKETVGYGNANKEQVCAWLKDTHPEMYVQTMGDQNLVDATCIAWYGVHHQRVGAVISEELISGELPA